MQQTERGKLLAHLDEARYLTMLDTLGEEMDFIDRRYCSKSGTHSYRFLDLNNNLISIEGIHGTTSEYVGGVYGISDYLHTRFKVFAGNDEEKEKELLEELETRLKELNPDSRFYGFGKGGFKIILLRKFFEEERRRRPQLV